MNVVIIGSGGREHAIAYKLIDSEKLENLYFIPGNPGTQLLGENVILNISDKKSILNFCIQNSIDLVIIGPEKPLVDGLSDMLRDNSINVFGPSSKAARIESEKSYAKWLMKKYNIPTADYVEFNSLQYDETLSYLKTTSFPKVIKADGLAAGKGVIICNSYDSAKQTIDSIFKDKIFGKSGDKIVIEEFLEGEEVSIFAITDGNKYITLPVSQDHKRIGDNDTGKNTGGMGAYAPVPYMNKKIIKNVETNIISPILKAMVLENNPFSGCLYCGLMISDEKAKVVEFNCRFGDPETQVVLPLLDGNFLELLHSAAIGDLNMNAVSYNGGSAVCVIVASKGYPDEYKTGYIILGIDKIDDPDIVIFHAGTKQQGSKLLTNGGRVLGVTAIIDKIDLLKARSKAYNAINKINFTDIYFRRDIALKAVKKSSL